jgi:pimeloyl-ACP methyl ester carboxylesterase
MAATTQATTRLAYDDEGVGTPVVLLHGLTFDRRTWRPIVERLGGSVRSISIDLPAHGESGGAPPPVEEVPDRIHELLTVLEAERPIVVGHSMSGGFAGSYAAAYPTRGLVFVDNGPDIRPFAELVRRLESLLRGPEFVQVWSTFESSLGLEQIPEPVRSLVMATHEVNRDVVLGYWDMLLHTDPAALQTWIDTQVLAKITAPCLAVFGRATTDSEHERFGWLPDVQLEEWTGDGHFVHLVEPDRFAIRLRRFVDHCTATG